VPSRPAPRDDADRGELVVEELTEDLGRAQTWPRTPGGAGSARGPPTPPPQPAGGPAPAGAARVALPHLGRHALFDAQVRAPVVGDVVVIGEALGGPQTQIGQGDPVGVGVETRADGVADALLPAGEGEAVPMLPAAPERGLQHRVQLGDPIEDTDAVWEKTTMSSTRPRRPGKPRPSSTRVRTAGGGRGGVDSHPVLPIATLGVVRIHDTSGRADQWATVGSRANLRLRRPCWRSL